MVRVDTTAVQRSEVQDKGGGAYAHHQGRDGEQGGGDRNIANLLRSNSNPILRYFYRRESNAKAEALNQNLQRFVSVNYGARNTDFFHYRIALHFS